MPINGSSLDTRLQNKILLDPKLQRRLSGDEFRSFINLMVWTVSLVSDGVFDADESEMVISDRTHIDRLAEIGVVEKCSDIDLYRVHPDYWCWQTTKAQLEKMDADRAKDRQRKRDTRGKAPQYDSPPPPEPPLNDDPQSHDDPWEAQRPY